MSKGEKRKRQEKTRRPRGSGTLAFLSFGGLDEKEALVTCKSYVTQRLLTKPAQDVTKV